MARLGGMGNMWNRLHKVGKIAGMPQAGVKPASALGAGSGLGALGTMGGKKMAAGGTVKPAGILARPPSAPARPSMGMVKKRFR